MFRQAGNKGGDLDVIKPKYNEALTQFYTVWELARDVKERLIKTEPEICRLLIHNMGQTQKPWILHFSQT